MVPSFRFGEPHGGAADAWAFVPATDLLLLVGDGIVGCGAEGFVAQADEGHLRSLGLWGSGGMGSGRWPVWSQAYGCAWTGMFTFSEGV